MTQSSWLMTGCCMPRILADDWCGALMCFTTPYMHVHAYTHTYIYMSIYIRVYTYIFVYIHMYITTPYMGVHAYTHSYIYIYMSIYIHVYTYIYVYIYICLYIYIYIYMYGTLCRWHSQVDGRRTAACRRLTQADKCCAPSMCFATPYTCVHMDIYI